MQAKHITFIGGGNMAGALILGLATQPDYVISVADPSASQREQLGRISGVHTFDNNVEAIEQADCIVFAVKPQIMRGVCLELVDTIARRQPLLISVAAGIDCDAISRWYEGYRRTVRVMPNTPALLGHGATGLFADTAVTSADKQLAGALFDAVGLTAWVDEEPLIDAVTAVSGSGPAYFFYMLEAMEDAAVEHGLPRELAQQLARQTALGAAHMALNESGQLQDVRSRVTSPGGTTAAALEVLAQDNLPSILQAAMDAARARAQSLASEFGAD